MQTVAMALDETRPLLDGLRRGDDDAFAALVRQQAGRMLATARRLLRSDQDAEDAVQEAFVSAARAIDGFAGGSKVSTWLHRIVINACLMKLRSRRRKPEEDIEQYLPRFLEDGHQVESSAAWNESAETALQRAETCNIVRAAIARLPESYRVVLTLRDIEELTTDEVAQMLGTTPNAVKIRLHRGRQALRTLLDPHMRGKK